VKQLNTFKDLSLTSLIALLLFFSPLLTAKASSASIDLNVLTIESLVLPLCAGTSPTFRVFIKNNGSTDSGFFNIRWDADGRLFDGGHFNIPAGATDTHDHIWQNIPSGQYTLTFITDPDNFLPESRDSTFAVNLNIDWATRTINWNQNLTSASLQ
jgi:CARDB